MAEPVHFKLRDYLLPGGKYPRSALAGHLEECRKAGNRVMLWSVPGFFMLSGWPDTEVRPWSDGDKWYKTAQNCMDHKNGRT